MIRLSSHRLPFSLSIGSAPIPPTPSRTGADGGRVDHLRGGVALSWRAGARTRSEARPRGGAALVWHTGGAWRYQVGDELWLLGLGDDEDALLFGDRRTK